MTTKLQMLQAIDRKLSGMGATIDAVIFAQTGRKHSMEHREKIALATIGKKRTRLKMSESEKREKDDG